MSANSAPVSTHPPQQHRFRAIMPLKGIEDSRVIQLSQIQGDVYPSFSKKVETFWFFSITVGKEDAFRKDLANFVSSITTAAQLVAKLREIAEVHRKFAGASREEKNQNLVINPQINIAFSAAGFKALGYDPSLVGDDFYTNGMGSQAVNWLGDHPVKPGEAEVDWDPEFKQTIHGVVLAAAESEETLNQIKQKIKDAIGDSTTTVLIFDGALRPGDQTGHEHFGFLDGISQPALRGLSEPLPGQLQCDPGIIIMGHSGDSRYKERPTWTDNGSLMAFRKLRQYVPEFNQWLENNPAAPETWKDSGMKLSKKQQVELTGARMFGRWKSGAPLDIMEFVDNPALGSNKFRNNNFDYTSLDPTETNGVPGQLRCPFAAHARKMAPRKGTSRNIGATPEDDAWTLERAMIVRAAIQYGPELQPDETTQTKEDRGLAFVCYQSNLRTGFGFLQHNWANNQQFPSQYTDVVEAQRAQPGFDPIIGSNQGKDRPVTGLNASAVTQQFDIGQDFVVARGGEYFFVPSIDTLAAMGAGKPLPPRYT